MGFRIRLRSPQSFASRSEARIEAEGKYLIAQYFNNANANSNEAEARQAEAIGEALGAAAAITEDVADRRCRAAGTC
jgi:hypothetical protein